MSLIKKIIQLSVGFALIILAVFLIVVPELAVEYIAAIIFITLFIGGIRYLAQYFSMARYMVGGRTIFYTGLIMLDLSLISWSLIVKSQLYIMLYLVGIYVFYGVVQLLHSFETKRNENSAWKIIFINAVINLLIALTCLCFAGSLEIMVYVYGAGVIYTGLTRIVSIFRKEEQVVIQ